MSVPIQPWFTSALRDSRSTVRHAENLWKDTHSAADWSSFKSVRNKYHNLILIANNTTTPSLSLHLLTTPNVSGKLSTNYCTANLLHPCLPLPHVSHLLTASLLSSPTISKLCMSLASNPNMTYPHLPSSSATPPVFSTLTPASETQIHKILSNCPNKQSDSDPIPTWLLKGCASVNH